MPLTDDQVRDWIEHPVTEAVRDLIREEVARQKEYLVARYLAGEPRPDSERDAILLMARWVEAFLSMPPEEIRADLEKENER